MSTEPYVTLNCVFDPSPPPPPTNKYNYFKIYKAILIVIICIFFIIKFYNGFIMIHYLIVHYEEDLYFEINLKWTILTIFDIILTIFQFNAVYKESLFRLKIWMLLFTFITLIILIYFHETFAIELLDL